MTIETIEGVTKLTAAEDKHLTDRKGTTGRTIYLGVGRTAAEFFEVDAAAEDAPDAVQRIADLETVIDGMLEVLA